jgi:hypothetical protein
VVSGVGSGVLLKYLRNRGDWRLCERLLSRALAVPPSAVGQLECWPACPGPLVGRPLSASSEWPGRDAAGARAATAWDGLQPHINNFAVRSLGGSPGQSPSHGPGLGRGCWLDGEGETVRARGRKFGLDSQGIRPHARRLWCLSASLCANRPAAKVRGSVQQLSPSSASHLISDKTLHSLLPHSLLLRINRSSMR